MSRDHKKPPPEDTAETRMIDREIGALVERMQSARQRRAADQLMEMAGPEMGEAAVRCAMTRKSDLPTPPIGR